MSIDLCPHQLTKKNDKKKVARFRPLANMPRDVEYAQSSL